MSDSKHNNPPFAVLELNQVEHDYLTKLMDRAHGQAEELFKDVCGMPSSDPRAVFRASLSMAAALDMTMTENIAELLEKAVE